MSNLLKEKKLLEIKKVSVAKAEMEYKILERLEDIERLKKNIGIQEKRVLVLEKELQGEENG